jgi:hypothetical protein
MNEKEEGVVDDSAIKVVEKRRQTISAYQKIFTSEEGCTVLHDLMSVFHFYGTTASPDPYETHFNEGQRSVILAILGTLKVDSEKYTQHIQQLKEKKDVSYFNYGENVS